MTDGSCLSDKQKSVISLFEQGKNLFITGGAGSGKSYLLNFLKKNYGHLGLEVTASTGIAAVNIGGSTIHSWAGIGLANLPIKQIVENIFSAKFARVRRRIRCVKALAIDEISIISSDVLEILNKVFCAVRENSAAMGGIQMLFFGDFLQLPPVNSGFCFNSKIWHDLDLQTITFEEIFRQEDKKFIKLLNNLRFGKVDENDRDALISRLKAKDETSTIRPTILSTHNVKVEKINEHELQKILHNEVIHLAEYFGSNEKILTISSEEWLIEKFDEEKKLVITEAGMLQVPLILAWAMTIHKSQGMTLDKISCDLAHVFSPGQAYVALSRARNFDGVFIESMNFDRIAADDDAVKFYQFK